MDIEEIIRANRENDKSTPNFAIALRESPIRMNANIVQKEIARLERENFQNNRKINSILKLNDVNYTARLIDLQEEIKTNVCLITLMRKKLARANILDERFADMEN